MNIKEISNIIDLNMGSLEKYLSSILFAALFIVFLINIIARYFFTAILWGYELSLLLFLWITIFGSCYANRLDENIKFDSFYMSGSAKRRYIFDIVGSLLVITTFTISLIPSIDYINFLNFESSDTLPFKMNQIFSVYIYFVIVMIIQYAKKLIISIRGLFLSNYYRG